MDHTVLVKRRAAGDRAQEIAEAAASHDFAKGLFVPPAAIKPPPRNDGTEYRSEEEAFPPIAPRCRPLGNLVQVMMRVPVYATRGGMYAGEEGRQTQRDNTRVAKVVGVGPLAFRNRNTGELWPEGAWCKVGDYVRVGVPQDVTVVKYDRKVLIENDVTGLTKEEIVEDRVIFVLFKDLDLRGVYESAEDALAEGSFDL